MIWEENLKPRYKHLMCPTLKYEKFVSFCFLLKKTYQPFLEYYAKFRILYSIREGFII